MAIESYNALALQVECRAVNRCSTAAAARSRMMETIEHCRELISGSKRFIATFSGTATRLVVLPEYFMTGFPMGESVPDWIERACIHQDGPEYRALGEVARGCAVYLSGNAYEVDPAFPELYFQVSFIIDDGGEVVLRYRRLLSMFAPTPHDVLDRFLDAYGEDALFPVVDTPLGRLACVASEEILYPEVARALVLNGAELLCHSSSEVGSPQPTPKNIAKRARAYENMCYLVSANSAGIADIPFPAASTDGHSQVVSWKGQVLAEAGSGESVCGFADIDIAGLRASRSVPAMTNLLARQRPDLFRRVYERQLCAPGSLLQGDGLLVPDRDHFVAAQQEALDNLRRQGVLPED